MNELHITVEMEDWSDDAVSYISNIREQCIQEANRHDKAGYVTKNLNNYISLPAILVPLISAPIQGTFKDDDWTPYFSMSALVISSIFTGINSFFNYGTKSQKHFNFSGRYGDMVTDIDEILSKRVDKRQPSDVFIRTQKLRFDNLNLTAPK